MDHREYEKLWDSLTMKERMGALEIISAQEERRKKEFYAAKAARGEKLPRGWKPEDWNTELKLSG